MLRRLLTLYFLLTPGVVVVDSWRTSREKPSVYKRSIHKLKQRLRGKREVLPPKPKRQKKVAPPVVHSIKIHNEKGENQSRTRRFSSGRS